MSLTPMGLTHVICDTQSGDQLSPVFPSASGWGCMLNVAGDSKSTTFELADETNTKINYKDLTKDDWSRTLVTCWNGVVRDAQIITDYDLDRDHKRLTVNHSPFRKILAKRFPFGATSYWADEANHIPGKLSLTNLEYQSIISSVLSLGTTGLFDSYPLPLVLPPIVAGTHSKELGNWAFVTVDDLITEQQNAQGGPDVYFEPRWSSLGKLEYLARTGTDAAPGLTGDLYEFHMNTKLPALTGVHKRGDGNKRTTGVFTIGAGTEQDMLVVGRGLGDAATGPALDTTQSNKTDTDVLSVTGQSEASLAKNRYSVEQWDFNLVADGDPNIDLGNMRLGSTIRLLFSGDFWEADGHLDFKLMGLSGDMTPIMHPVVQPVVLS